MIYFIVTNSSVLCSLNTRSTIKLIKNNGFCKRRDKEKFNLFINKIIVIQKQPYAELALYNVENLDLKGKHLNISCLSSEQWPFGKK